MAIIDSVRAFALADANIVAKIGARFYIAHVPDEASTPFVLLRDVDDNQLYHEQGAGGHIPLYQLDAYVETKSESETLAELLMTRFAGYSGIMGDVTVGYIFAERKFGEWSPETRNFRNVLELRIGSNDR